MEPGVELRSFLNIVIRNWILKNEWIRDRTFRGPALADPGYSKWGWRRQPTYLFIKDIKSNTMRIAQ